MRNRNIIGRVVIGIVLMVLMASCGRAYIDSGVRYSTDELAKVDELKSDEV